MFSADLINVEGEGWAGEHDSHVLAYYSQPASAFEEYASSKFEGETVALAIAYERSLDGQVHDEFGSVEDAYGYHARVLFDHAPFIVCFCEDDLGLVTEIGSSEYEARWALYVEDGEDNCDHDWQYTGSAYGGEDDSYHGEGRCYCSKCGADGDG